MLKYIKWFELYDFVKICVCVYIYIFNIYLYIFNVAFYEQIFAKMNLFIVQEQTGLTIDAHWPRTLYHSSKKAIAKLNIV